MGGGSTTVKPDKSVQAINKIQLGQIQGILPKDGSSFLSGLTSIRPSALPSAEEMHYLNQIKGMVNKPFYSPVQQDVMSLLATYAPSNVPIYDTRMPSPGGATWVPPPDTAIPGHQVPPRGTGPGALGALASILSNVGKGVMSKVIPGSNQGGGGTGGMYNLVPQGYKGPEGEVVGDAFGPMFDPNARKPEVMPDFRGMREEALGIRPLPTPVGETPNATAILAGGARDVTPQGPVWPGLPFTPTMPTMGPGYSPTLPGMGGGVGFSASAPGVADTLGRLQDVGLKNIIDPQAYGWLEKAADPDARLAAAKAAFEGLVSPEIINQMVASGQGGGGAMVEALSKGGLAMTLPILSEVASAQQEVGRQRLHGGIQQGMFELQAEQAAAGERRQLEQTRVQANLEAQKIQAQLEEIQSQMEIAKFNGAVQLEQAKLQGATQTQIAQLNAATQMQISQMETSARFLTDQRAQALVAAQQASDMENTAYDRALANLYGSYEAAGIPRQARLSEEAKAENFMLDLILGRGIIPDGGSKTSTNLGTLGTIGALGSIFGGGLLGLRGR